MRTLAPFLNWEFEVSITIPSFHVTGKMLSDINYDSKYIVFSGMTYGYVSSINISEFSPIYSRTLYLHDETCSMPLFV